MTDPNQRADLIFNVAEAMNEAEDAGMDPETTKQIVRGYVLTDPDRRANLISDVEAALTEAEDAGMDPDTAKQVIQHYVEGRQIGDPNESATENA